MRIRADKFGGERFAVDHDFDFFGFLDDVVVRDDETFLVVDYETRTLSLTFSAAGLHRIAEKEVKKRIPHSLLLGYLDFDRSNAFFCFFRNFDEFLLEITHVGSVQTDCRNEQKQR